jgi:FlaA1/EpsC-like NDP-sugar epimerase
MPLSTREALSRMIVGSAEGHNSPRILFGLYRRLWRYASISEIVMIAEAVLLGSALAGVFILFGLVQVSYIWGFPRSIILLEGLLTLFLVGGIRFSFRILRPSRTHATAGSNLSNSAQRILVIGAGNAGARSVREIHMNSQPRMNPVAFLDDDPAKWGLRIHNVPVLGDRSMLPTVVESQAIDLVAIAMPTAPGRVIREIADACLRANVAVRTIPGLPAILSGSVKVSTLREVDMADLLRREPG